MNENPSNRLQLDGDAVHGNERSGGLMTDGPGGAGNEAIPDPLQGGGDNGGGLGDGIASVLPMLGDLSDV